MVTIKFNLKHNQKRLYGTVQTDIIIQGFKIRSLIDTGSDIAVWTSDEDDLLAYFPEARYDNSVVIASGFGQGKEVAKVYRIPDFVISDNDGNEVLFKNFVCAVIPKDFSNQLVLSYSLFEKANIYIRAHENEKRLDCNTIEFEFPKKENVVSIRYREVSEQERTQYSIPDEINVLGNIYVFSQNEEIDI